MQRHLNVNLGGKELKLAATWGAGEEIAEIADPLEISREAALDALFAENGVPYSPAFSFKMSNVFAIIWAGYKAGGGDLTKEEVQAIIAEAGLIEARNAAAEFIGFLCNPASEELDKADKGDPEKK